MDQIIDPSQGFEVCIKCLPDGTFNVSAEPLDSVSEQRETDPGMPAQSIDDALSAAKEVYGKASGQTFGAAEENAAMQSAFSAARGGR